MGGVDVAQVEDDDSEASAVEEEIGGLHGVFDMVAALDPDEGIEVGSSLGSGCRVEGVGAIDHGAIFTAFGGGGEEAVDEAGAAGGGGSDDFADASAGATAKDRVEGRDADRESFHINGLAPSKLVF